MSFVESSPPRARNGGGEPGVGKAWSRRGSFGASAFVWAGKALGAGRRRENAPAASSLLCREEEDKRAAGPTGLCVYNVFFRGGDGGG